MEQSKQNRRDGTPQGAFWKVFPLVGTKTLLCKSQVLSYDKCQVCRRGENTELCNPSTGLLLPK